MMTWVLVIAVAAVGLFFAYRKSDGLKIVPKAA
jgi:hypothetical protein